MNFETIHRFRHRPCHIIPSRNEFWKNSSFENIKHGLVGSIVEIFLYLCRFSFFEVQKCWNPGNSKIFSEFL